MPILLYLIRIITNCVNRERIAFFINMNALRAKFHNRYPYEIVCLPEAIQYSAITTSGLLRASSRNGVT